jgi:predicted ATPase
MRAVQKTFAEEFDRVLVESDTSVRRLARLSDISRRTLENWLYGYTLRPRYIDQILQVARALKLPAVKTDRLLLSAGYPTLTRLKQKNQLSPDILLEWQLPPDTQKGQRNSALHHAQQLLQQMPWNEEAHCEVMELLALNGRRSEALKQFKICEQVLQDELGVEPSPETLALYERIRRTTHFSRDNIPAITTPLIGREEEMESLSGLLANPNVRLVTITGLGGIGKTRLALEIAWQQTKGQFSDGVTFVQMAELLSTELMVPAIAQALHLPLSDSNKKLARQQLLDYLKAKNAMLVLDNCEHLLDGMAIVAEIISAAPQVQILATSRDRLRLLAEHLFPLQGLPYEETHTSHPAAQLVQSTAQRINPHFKISDLNAPSVNKICRMVDGMPLALELAASWLDTTPVATVVAQVEKSLDYLAADLHDIPPRHRSLRGLMESIWIHLEPQSRQVFAALSVFRGSFSADAALDVAKTTPKILDDLVQHSLLKHEPEQDRYHLHEMLRQFAHEKLSKNAKLEQAVENAISHSTMI